MNIFPDPMLVLVQVVPFLVLLAGLHVLLFKPMLDYLDVRHAATDGARAEAARLREATGAQLDRYEAAVTSARNEVAELRATRRAAAHAEHARRIVGARTEADGVVRGEVARLREETTAARQELSGRSRSLAQELARRVLGRELPSMEA